MHTEDTVAEATSLLCRLTAWIEELPHSPAEKTRLLNRLPQATTSTWICRVRKAHSLTPQSVNAKYKVSYDKLVARMGVAWRNAARLMALHEILFGPGKLRVLSFDEKQYWHNALGSHKVWACRGTRRRQAKELRADMLERWAWVTVPPS